MLIKMNLLCAGVLPVPLISVPGLKIEFTLELDHEGWYLGSVECMAMVDDFGDVIWLYVIGTKGHLSPEGLKKHRIDLDVDHRASPLLASIAKQAPEITRSSWFCAEVEIETGRRRAAA